jgi:excisionase family DNA binding protein
MHKTTQLPESIVIAVNSLLNPYGVDIQRQISQPNTDTSKPTGIKYLSPSDAAKYASMSRWTIHRAIKAGKLPASKMTETRTGKVLIDIADLEKWINGRRIKIKPGV